MSPGPVIHQSRASRPTSASTRVRRSLQDRHALHRLPDRYLPARLLRRARRPPGRNHRDCGTTAHRQPDCLFTDGTTNDNLVDCGNWAVSASWAVPAMRSPVSTSHGRPARTSAATGASHIPFIVRDDDGGVRPARPDVRHDLAGLQPVRRLQPLRRTGRRSRAQGQLQPTVHDPRHAHRGLALQRRVPDGPLARAQRLRRQLLHRRRLRRTWRGDPRAQGLHVVGPRRVLVGRAAGQRRGRPRRRREPRVLQRQRGLLEDPLGAIRRWLGHAVPDAGRLQGRRRATGAPSTATATATSPATRTRTRGPALATDTAGHDGGRPENALTGQISWVNSTTAIQVPAADDESFLAEHRSIVGATGTTTLDGTRWVRMGRGSQPEFASTYPAGRSSMSETERTRERRIS